ncbi:hypothetical protein NL364_28410, partial [Klebsiella pneumoniae]|nr:hypothetical protein [Klebsiella pneumoniae]
FINFKQDSNDESLGLITIIWFSTATGRSKFIMVADALNLSVGLDVLLTTMKGGIIVVPLNFLVSLTFDIISHAGEFLG